MKARDLQLPLDTQKIIALIGVRRCGKTSILYNMINKLSHTIDKTKILFLNFEDERLDLSDEHTRDREVKGLLQACKHFNLTVGAIVTYDDEDEWIEDGICIKLIPFYKWCL